MTGLVHGGLTGQDLSKLTGLSALLCDRWDGDSFTPGEIYQVCDVAGPVPVVLANEARCRELVVYEAFTYLGEYADDTRTVILAPEGGWKSNPFGDDREVRGTPLDALSPPQRAALASIGEGK